MKTQKGFTIIELIVAIAIIAVLSGIVLADVGKYNKNGKDSAIKEQISQIRIAGTDFFSINSTYYGMCDVGVTKCDQIKANIINLGGSLGFSYIPIAGNIYCINFTLSSGGGWCVDNTGYNGPQGANTCGALHTSCNS